MKTYLAVNLIKACPAASPDGRQGYYIEYPGGPTSWIPKEILENACLEIEHTDCITEPDIERIIYENRVQKIGDKTTLVNSILRTGFEEVETSSCVVPEKFNQEIGMDICLERIKSRIWGHLGFVLQWAKYGLKNKQGN